MNQALCEPDVWKWNWTSCSCSPSAAQGKGHSDDGTAETSESSSGRARGQWVRRSAYAACLLLLACAALQTWLQPGAAASALHSASRRFLAAVPYPTPRPPTLEVCHDKYGDYRGSIYEDLMPWASTGITLDMMERTIATEGYWGGSQGLPFSIRNGSVYVVDGGHMDAVFPWHARELIIYAHIMSYLGRKFGKSLPNVEFLLRTDDETAHDMLGMLNRTQQQAPVFRYCRGDDNGEVLIPIWHMWEQHFSKHYLSRVAEANSKYPWQQKQAQLFSVPGGYHRYVSHTGANQKHGRDGGKLVYVREEFLRWANDTKDPRLNVTSAFMPMPDWAQFKYVAHVDGISCSSRYEKLLSLGSLVVKEESGYRSFFHRLLKPYQHYVPFWRHRPQEALQVLGWAAEHDEEARKIAQAGQRLVKKYLAKEGIYCYWLMLLHEWSKLLRYSPASAQHNFTQYLTPVDEWIEKQRGHLVWGQDVWVSGESLEYEDPPEQQQ